MLDQCLSIHSPAKRHLDYFYFLAITNNVAECLRTSLCVGMLLFYLLIFCLFVFSRAFPLAYGDSQARGPIGAVAPGLHHSSRQRRILNPPNKAGDQTHNLMVPTTEPRRELLGMFLFLLCIYLGVELLVCMVN